MAGRSRNRVISPGVLLLWATILPALVGQGCPGIGPGIVSPVDPGQGIPGLGTGGGAPTLTFTYPLEDVAVSVGQTVNITWVATDPRGNAAITLLLDPDRTYGNGNEIIILPFILASNPNGGSFAMNTSSYPPATYRVIGRISDGVNPEQIIAATGRILLYGSGLLPGNASPSILLTQPVVNRGVSQGDQVEIRYCARDRDDNGKSPPTAPDVLIMLDLDDNPTNDIKLSDFTPELVRNEICSRVPLEVRPYTVQTNPLTQAKTIKWDYTQPPTGYVLGCFTDTDCGEPYQDQATDANGAPITDSQGNPVFVTRFRADAAYQLTIDVGTIPPRLGGAPYHVRGLIWDHVNPQVNSYAPGTISITALGSGTIDMASVGRTVSGTRFLGFNAGDWTGSNGVELGDIDGDGNNDFVIVGRFGNSFYRYNGGSAYVVMGLTNGGKFASEIPLNSAGTFYRGSILGLSTPEPASQTDGITSVCRLADVTGDGRPDILFGLPYMEGLWDDTDDDPCDNEGCYGDLFPNPWSSPSPATNDVMTTHDYRDGTVIINDIPYICSNDYDLLSDTPLDGGYAILVASNNNLANDNRQSIGARAFALDLMGQRRGTFTDGWGNDIGEHIGARYRGGLWPIPVNLLLEDSSQTENPSLLVPDNRFGQTVASMPPMTNASLTISPRFGEVTLLSAPNNGKGRGTIDIVPRNSFINGLGLGNTSSMPVCDRRCMCSGTCRAFWYPDATTIVGRHIGDNLGYAGPAGDFNLDGSRDILAGAPGATRNGVARAGIVYIFMGRPDWSLGLTFWEDRNSGFLMLDRINAPRIEIHGTRTNDQFGTMQTIVGDINQDGLPDIGFSSQYADGPGGVDSGFIGIVFGGRRLTGENVFNVNQVATAQLPGVKIHGTQPGGHAGTVINTANDFNGDSIDDLLIVAPDEVRTIGGVQRRGLAYLIFGGTHMMGNKTFTLSQVGTPELPGIVFVSPYTRGTADEAPIDWAGPAGDINDDGFDDILVGVSRADYVYLLDPSQRRNDAGEMYLIYGSNTGSNTPQQ
ncbi:MAG TPA: VCBS repeat-containing protein [Phycisphaerae bacterium]|nr:VCBS repeat-containing protein [Phycisphaerae bacterium]